MLAIIILVGVFYLALNCADKYQGRDNSSITPPSNIKSFKECERHLKDGVEVSVHF